MSYPMGVQLFQCLDWIRIQSNLWTKKSWCHSGTVGILTVIMFHSWNKYDNPPHCPVRNLFIHARAIPNVTVRLHICVLYIVEHILWCQYWHYSMQYENRCCTCSPVVFLQSRVTKWQHANALIECLVKVNKSASDIVLLHHAWVPAVSEGG